MSHTVGRIPLRYKVYTELRRIFSGGNFVFAAHLAQPGLGAKAWVECESREDLTLREGAVRSDGAPYGEGQGGVSWRCLARTPRIPFGIFILFTCLFGRG